MKGPGYGDGPAAGGILLLVRPDPLQILRRAGLSAQGLERLAGGDVSEVWRAGPYVLKLRRDPPPGMFEAEARGLYALMQAGARVPGIVWAGEEGLVLEYLPPTAPDWEAFARTLAALHRLRPPAYGWDTPVFLGSFRLPEGTLEDWSLFWTEYRVRPLLEAAWGRLGELGPKVERSLQDPLPAEGPALLHGDLWHGNVHFSSGPVLLDPSAWWGERAVDLAMMRLFGGFPPEFWRYYRALYPVPAEVEAAIPRYQLYYLLAHVHFFGQAYLPALERTLLELGFR